MSFGLTVSNFFDGLPRDTAMKFVPVEVIDLIESLSTKSDGELDATEVVKSVVDFGGLLEDPIQRNLIIGLLSEEKRRELASRLHLEFSAREVFENLSWTAADLVELKAFFGMRKGLERGDELVNQYLLEPKFGLFDHQRAAVKELRKFLISGSDRALLHLPTGVGKTRTAMHLVCEVLIQKGPCVVVWLASGKELLEQAEETFKEAWGNLGNRALDVLTMWGSSTPDFSSFNDGLLVAGLQKGNSYLTQDPTWARVLSQRTALVVFDEAHQSVAPTYKELTEDLMFAKPCGLLGLTATPGRTWNDIDEDRKLAAMYMENKISLNIEGYENPVKYLIEEGFLARPLFETLYSEPGGELSHQDLALIASNLDLPDHVVHSLTMSHQNISAVLVSVEDLIKRGHNRVLVFAASVRHAKILAGLLPSRGVEARVITGDSSNQMRTQAITSFKSSSNDPMVLVNYGVLTTGFDAPRVSAAVIARPTTSLVLYSQMVGRAIRGPKAGGTESCTIVTVVDPRLRGFGDVSDAFENWEDVWG